MPRSSRDEEFSAFVQTRRTGLVRSACLLTAGDTHLAEDLVQTALARLYVAWPRVRRAGTGPPTSGASSSTPASMRSADRRRAVGVVQAPVSLGWDGADLAKFASGVQVLVTAQQGRG